ncbi:ribosomal protein S18 acetylase RimI-like enzyme [Cryobacterium sp. CAN_C3]|uniref:GNAT family N-acetyltransferase n=1 Tax=unclassified Cryobacterium TaxID=2649013 RepID=UPI0018CAF82C|nr:GNAT family N-acetyltransferase [Cryobacterium sp. CAN_C3]MEC5155046.1 ribosomal protein S18 acetylase RimI-like enzyme [Cryobacterium sp. CAN_C3]
MSGCRILFALSTADAAKLADFHRVASVALGFDGYAPFNEQALFDLQSGLRTAYVVLVPGMAVSARSTTEDADVSQAGGSSADDGAGRGSEAGSGGVDGGTDGGADATIVVGAALGGRGEIDLVIIPEYRRRGYGRAAARELVANEPNGLTAWAHGDHPAARALASELRFVAARTLLELRKQLIAAEATSGPEAIAAEAATAPGTALESGAEPAAESGAGAFRAAAARETEAGASAALWGGSVSAFRPGVDDADWVALNALVFATHPEQGAITEADLAARQAELWFNADDFLILRDAEDRMIGYNWLKVDGVIGEIYVIGVHPDAAGRGLGRVLMQAGLQRLVDAGCATAALYVEADSVGAVHLYRALGFVDHTVDVQYRRLAD